MQKKNSSKVSSFTRKRALIDASSAIILFKAGLHGLLAEVYDVIMAGSVYRELTELPYPGSAEYRMMTAEGMILVCEPADNSPMVDMGGIDTGEYDTIRLLYSGLGDFIITDDGGAARYCRKNGIPFINSLLFPVALRIAQLESKASCRESMDKIAGIGRYSDEVITFARTCGKESLDFVIP